MEATYLLIATFVVVEAMIMFLPNVNQPNYDMISALKVAHDMGQNNTSSPPEISPALKSNYDFGVACGNRNDTIKIAYYDYGAATDERVCTK